MEFSLFSDAAVGGVPLLFIVLGLVEWIKKFGLSGKIVVAVSMLVGLLFGGGYMIANLGAPADFGGWFTIAVYGIGIGLVASGIYDVGQKLAQKQ